MGEAEQWQVTMLLADMAAMVGEHSHAVAVLEELRESGSFPKEARSKVRRALFFARLRENGRPVPGD